MIFDQTKSILKIREGQTISTALHQSTHCRHVPAFLEIIRTESFLKGVIVQPEIKLSLSRIKLHPNNISRSIALLEINSVFIGSIPKFSGGIISIPIFDIRECFFDIDNFRVFDNTYFEEGTFKYFDFPIIAVMLVHDNVCVVVFVNTNRCVDLNCSSFITFKLKVTVPILWLPIEVDEIRMHPLQMIRPTIIDSKNMQTN